MHWHFRKLHYDILVPKLEKNISQLSEAEAAAYFDWFMEQMPGRVAYVSEICAKELGVSVEKMDRSPESLVLLWKWFRRRAKTERVPGAANKERETMIPQARRQLTLETEYILRDVGMYFGEVFCRNHPGICWSYYTSPKRDFFVNHPLLKGFVDRSFEKPFDACVEPIHYAGVQASKILKGNSRDEDLYNIYCFWAERA